MDDYLLYTAETAFVIYELKKKKSIRFQIAGYENIVAIETAYDKRILFFADKDRDDIVVIDTKVGNITTLLGFDSSSVYIEALAYDWIGDNLYYCDSGKAVIGIINVKGKHKKELIDADVLDRPKTLIVHPKKGYRMKFCKHSFGCTCFGLCETIMIKFVAEIVRDENLLTIFPKKLYHRCLKRPEILLC